MPFSQSSTAISGSSPMGTNADQNSPAARRTPLTARKRRCLRSCSINRAYSPAGMKCWGTHIKLVVLAEYCVLICPNPSHSM